MKTSIKISLAIIIVLGLVISEIYLFKNTRPSPLREERIIYIPPQTSFKKVAQLLKRENIITNVFYFTLYARWHGAITKIKSGELLFYSNAKPREVLNILLEGHPVLYAAVIPEGWNIYEIADRLSELQLVDRDGFLKTCFDKEWLTKINVKGPSCEGYLFPETYQFSKYLGEQKIIQVMIEKFNRVYDQVLQEAALEYRITKNNIEKKLELSRKEIITLASIIEKETGIAYERPLIASVFHNRLKKGMKLQSDPTTIYGIWELYTGNLTREDLMTRTPYNTYAFYGLPLGPIANPGYDSLRAALIPLKTSYLYFVSKNDGSHQFSKNLVEHNRAVQLYQSGQ